MYQRLNIEIYIEVDAVASKDLFLEMLYGAKYVMRDEIKKY